MRKELWIPARPGLPSHDSDPEIPTEQKLETIKAKQILRAVPDREYHGLYKVQLPYTKGATFILDEASREITLVDLDLGNQELRGHGVGTRLLQGIIEYGTRKHPDMQTVRRGVGNWALVRTLGKVLGGDGQVRFEKGPDNIYGHYGDYPLETALEHYPPEEGEEYSVKNIVGYIDLSRLMSRQDAIAGITTSVD